MKVKLIVLLSCIVFFTLAVSQGLQAEKNTEQVAIEAANAWLDLVDEEKYSESWDETAQYFKNAISKEQWQATLTNGRTPFGKTISRKLDSSQYATSLPGAPDGEYVVIQYKTSFENKKFAIETITPMVDKDGKWRVSGYYIK